MDKQSYIESQARSAASALRVLAYDQSNGDAHFALRDLLCALMHHTRQDSLLSFADELAAARSHYDDERRTARQGGN